MWTTKWWGFIPHPLPNDLSLLPFILKNTLPGEWCGRGQGVSLVGGNLLANDIHCQSLRFLVSEGNIEEDTSNPILSISDVVHMGPNYCLTRQTASMQWSGLRWGYSTTGRNSIIIFGVLDDCQMFFALEYIYYDLTLNYTSDILCWDDNSCMLFIYRS